MLRGLCFLKTAAVVLADFALGYVLVGWWAAVLLGGGVLLYGWLGEYLALAKDGAIGPECLRGPERERMERLRGHVSADVLRVSGVDISSLRLNLLPSEEMNAYAYGFRNVALTRALLEHCDDPTLRAVLGHEVSHVLRGDAVFHRLVFANVTLLLGVLTLGSVVSMSALWLVFVLLLAFGACRGLGSLLIFQGMQKLVQGTFETMRRVLLFIYQAVMGLVSRGGEFRADAYSCALGYGPELCEYLTRFVKEGGPRTVRELLYASHPAPCKRVLRIEQQRGL